MPIRTLENYINTDKRIELAAEVTRLAKIYGDNFKRVENACDLNTMILGAMAQVMLATMQTENGLSTISMLPEAVDTAQSLLRLDAAKKNLRDDGVPQVIILEITRRVLDENIPDSREITLREV